MADKDSPFSMFSDSARSKKKPLRPGTTQLKKTEPVTVRETQTDPGVPVDAEEIRKMIDKAKKYRDDITQKIDQIQTITGWDINGLDSYLSNPRNFKPSEFEMVKQQKLALEAQFYKILGSVTGGSEGARTEVRKLEKEKDAKQRKGKTLGGRKGWMPMR